MNSNKLLYTILCRTKDGMTQEELANAIGKEDGWVRSAISHQRKAGKRIIDYSIPSKKGKRYFKKKYLVARSSEDFIDWLLRQQDENFMNMSPRRGAPRA